MLIYPVDVHPTDFCLAVNGILKQQISRRKKEESVSERTKK